MFQGNFLFRRRLSLEKQAAQWTRWEFNLLPSPLTLSVNLWNEIVVLLLPLIYNQISLLNETNHIALYF